MVNINFYEKHFLFIKGEIEKAIQKIPLNKTPNYLYDPIQYVINGKGKRLRPILVHLVGQAYSANPSDLMKVGIAVELLHNFTLVHDDIMDGDDTRHGQKSVHNKWDNSTAILSGDALFVLAQLSLKGLSDIIHQRFNEVALTICEGQGMDKEFENNSSISSSSPDPLELSSSSSPSDMSSSGRSSYSGRRRMSSSSRRKYSSPG